MNLVEIANELQMMDDKTVEGYLRKPMGQVPPFLAAAEMNRRKTIRTQGHAGKPVDVTPVVDKMTNKGLAGVQKFSGGGFVDYMQSINPFSDENIARMRATPWFADVGSDKYTGMGPGPMYIKTRQPERDIPSRAGLYSNEAYSDWPSFKGVDSGYSGRPVEPDWKITRDVAQGGVGVPRRAFPELDLKNLPSTDLTDAQQELSYEKLRKKYGKGVADKILEDIGKEKESVKARESTDRYESLLKAGLAMMAGRSRNAMINIGQGGIAGLDDYQKLKAQRQAELRDLSGQERTALLQQGAREDNITSAGIAQVDKERDRQHRTYQDALGIRGMEFGAKAEGAKFYQTADLAIAKLQEDAKARGDYRTLQQATLAANMLSQQETKAVALATAQVKQVMASPQFSTLSPEEQAIKQQELLSVYTDQIMRSPEFQKSQQFFKAMISQGLGRLGQAPFSSGNIPYNSLPVTRK